ncbi:hypothetical protein B7P43_G17132 [Cryptotermes secundus]|uniref:Mos1 transposase HTH domain-containing protein n=1 Tax=Cryptotermes secundus TaxID=105785 RepID=A0A2J7RCZ6_9NEOP|nr:hypothetical protein B7P43_G17132 [Cryptotermes secundus]
MFSKHEQQNWIKIECTRGHTARQWHRGLQEDCGESALPYRTVARWIKAFNKGRQNVADMRRPGRPSVSKEVYALSTSLESHRRHTIRELARETGLAHTTVNPPIILQGNARLHAAEAVADLFDRWGWEVLYHPPYSPELSPCDFDLIPKMKEPIRGIRFRTVPEVLQAVDRSIRTINTTGAAKDILRLPHHWQRVVHNAGDYILGQQIFETCIYLYQL